MTDFDRKAHMLAALAALTPSDINRATELRVIGGEHFDPMMEEIRAAVRDALTSDPRDPRDLSGDTVVEDANLIATYDVDLVVQLSRVLAAQDYDLVELPDGHVDRTSSRVMDVVGYALEEVYIQGADKLMALLNDGADRAEAAHDPDAGTSTAEDSDDSEDSDDWV